MTDTALVPQPNATIVEQVVIKGNLADLTPRERVNYYTSTCQSLGLNPLTQPFQYINLSGKLTLYATRGATDQLRQIHGVSITGLARERMEDLYVVTATARAGDGRTDESIGAVSIKGLSGDALANAFMKAETKAKRRVTLSIVGLGWLDESELDSIKDAQPIAVDADGVILEAPKPAAPAKTERLAANARALMDQRYDALSDEADALGIPHKTRNTRWTDDEEAAEGKTLLAAIKAKKESIPA